MRKLVILLAVFGIANAVHSQEPEEASKVKVLPKAKYEVTFTEKPSCHVRMVKEITFPGGRLPALLAEILSDKEFVEDPKNQGEDPFFVGEVTTFDCRPFNGQVVDFIGTARNGPDTLLNGSVGVGYSRARGSCRISWEGDLTKLESERPLVTIYFRYKRGLLTFDLHQFRITQIVLDGRDLLSYGGTARDEFKVKLSCSCRPDSKALAHKLNVGSIGYVIEPELSSCKGQSLEVHEIALFPKRSPQLKYLLTATSSMPESADTLRRCARALAMPGGDGLVLRGETCQGGFDGSAIFRATVVKPFEVHLKMAR